MAAKTRKLTPKQQAFVEQYLILLNATQAAIRAGYSAKTAKAIGSRLLTNVDVAAAIQGAMEKRRDGAECTREAVIAELWLIARSDIGDVQYHDQEGVLRVHRLDQMDPNKRRAIAELTQTSTEHYEGGKGEGAVPTLIEKVRQGAKMHPKTKALELLAQHFGLMAAQKHEHTGKDGGPIETSETKVRYVVKLPPEETEPTVEAPSQEQPKEQ